MLINPLSRPLDLIGDKAVNYIQDERRSIVNVDDRIFVPVYGPFYADSLEILDVTTGKVLKKNKDYQLLHLIKEATDASAKSVYAVIMITKQTITDIRYSYRVIGGRYSDLSGLYKDTIKLYANYKRPVFFTEITGLPNEFPPVPHTHHLFDLNGLGELVNALDLVINAIHSKDFQNWINVYTYLNAKIKDFNTYSKQVFSEIQESMNALIIKCGPFVGEYWAFANNVNPNTEYPFGDWERKGNYLLSGQMANDPSPLGSYEIASGYGLQAKCVAWWKFVKQRSNVSFKLTSNKDTINEGESVTFTLAVTGGVTGGENYKYTIGGVINQTGDFVINSSGLASLTITVPVDSNTNTIRNLNIKLTDYPFVYKDVEIIDVVKDGTYSIGFYKDQYGLVPTSAIDEGEYGYVVVKTTGIPNGTILQVITNGTVTNDDLYNPIPPTLTVNDNLAIIEIHPKLDFLTEGTEYLRVGVSSNNVVVPDVSTFFYIRDTSKTVTMDVYFANTTTSISELLETNEGSTIYLIIKTTNVLDNQPVLLQWSGSVDNSDFTNALPTSVNVINNSAVIPITVKLDETTEGVEILDVNVSLSTVFNMDKSIMLMDTSKGSGIDIRYSSNSIGTNSLVSVKEGDICYLVIRTDNDSFNGLLNLVWAGSATADDFLSELPVTIDIKNGYGFIKILVNPDETTEGNETLSVRVLKPNTSELLATQSVNIIDTSTSPTYSISFVNEQYQNITQTNEGDSIYALVETTQIVDGTVYYVQTLISDKEATSINNDVIDNVPTTIVIRDGKALLPINLKKNETINGDRNIQVRLKEGSINGNIIISGQLLLKDTSVVPTYTARWSSSFNTINNITSASAGQTIYLHIKTTSLATATPIYLEYGGAGLGQANLPNDFLQAHSSELLPRIVRVDSSGNAVVPIVISKTLLGNEALVIRLSLSRNASNVAPFLTSTLNLTKPTYALSFASNQAGSTTISTTKEGNTIYGVLRTTNVPNNTTFDIKVRIGNEDATVKNKDVTEEITRSITVINNIATFPIKLAKDNIVEGTEQLDFHLLYDYIAKDEVDTTFATATIPVTE